MTKEEKRKLYYMNNREKILKRQKQYNIQYNIDNKKRRKQYNTDNKERQKQYMKGYSKQWSKDNSELKCAASAKRRALRLDQTPELNDNDRLVIKLLYLVREQFSRVSGVMYHVDHIIPLSKGGYHEPHNLQVIPAAENLKKFNSLTYIIPRELCFRIEDLIEAVKDKISIEGGSDLNY